MNFNMTLPGFEEAKISKMEQVEDRMVLHVSMPLREQVCPNCQQKTTRVHDYRIQKINHLKLFERLTVIYYKRRRYRCACGKRFSEACSFVERYQRYSKEWNQVARIRAVKAKTFKEAADTLGTSSTTIIRRFETLVTQMPSGISLPKVIAIDEYKADTDAGTYQLIIADGETHEPIDILPNRRKDTIVQYLQQYGTNVEKVIMDMNPSFKAAVRKALNRPIIIADRFHYARYIHWALDEVRRKVQKDLHPYDRKKLKKMRYVLHKDSSRLTASDRWYLTRYLNLSEELRTAYELKESYKKWQNDSKNESDLKKVKEGLFAFYKTSRTEWKFCFS